MNTLRPARRALIAATGAILAVAALASPAGAQIGAFAPCKAPTGEGAEVLAPPRGAECATLPVPLDHSGATPGTVNLALARVPATGSRTGTLVILTGGPGEPAIPLAGPISLVLEDLRATHDLVFVDQRGTGASDAVECESTTTVKGVAACAEKLGARRAFWTTRETASDLEALRAGLGVEKLTLYGISYGAKVAGEYARRYPARTAGLILDSPAPVDGIDTTLALRTIGLPRVLREVCFPPSCKDFLTDPTAALQELVTELGDKALRGRAVLPTGRTRAGRITVDDLYALVVLSDLDPILRSELPAAVASGVLGDAQPLLRLATAVAGERKPPTLLAVNEARHLATSCVEGRLPWTPESGLTGRAEALAAAYANAPPARWAPFPAATVLKLSIAAQCVVWPSTPKPAGVPLQGPDVPVLVISGREDLRTPLEDARRTASQYPRSTVLPVPGVGHSVIGADVSGCAAAGVAAFLAGQPVAPCERAKRRTILRAPFIPASMRSLQRMAGVPGDAGRVATAVAVTLMELDRLAAQGTLSSGGTRLRIPGLRGGAATVSRRTVTLKAFQVIRGVRLSGKIRKRTGLLTVTAPGGITGAVRTGRGDAVRGTIGGHAVKFEVED